MSSVEELADLFSKIGFEEPKVKEIVKNKKVAQSLETLINDGPEGYEWTKSTRTLLHNLASLVKGAEIENIGLVVKGIASEDLKTALQVNAAFKYIKSNGATATKESMNENSGVGIEVTDVEVRASVVKYIEENKETILRDRYKLVPGIFANIKNLSELKWADPRLFKPIIDEEILKVLGPRMKEIWLRRRRLQRIMVTRRKNPRNLLKMTNQRDPCLLRVS